MLEIIKSLPQNYQDCIFMRYYQDMSHKEISEDLNINTKKVYNDLDRGKRMIKEKLQEMFSFAAIPGGANVGLSKLFEADSKAVVTKEMSNRFLENVSSLNMKNLSLTHHSAAVKAGVVVVAAGIITASVIFASTPKKQESQPIPTDMPIIVSLPSDTVQSAEPSAQYKVIKTVEDMIGVENANILYAFVDGEKSDMNEWNLFLEANKLEKFQEGYHPLEDATYTIYAREEQDKRLFIIDKTKDTNTLLGVVYGFGDRTKQMPYGAEIDLYYENSKAAPD